jgi:hypothetical protein
VASGPVAANSLLVASGLARVGVRSAPKTCQRGLPIEAQSPELGLLRTPTRASPLATKAKAKAKAKTPGALCALITPEKSKAKKSLHRCRLFSIWLHDLDSNQGPND